MPEEAKGPEQEVDKKAPTYDPQGTGEATFDIRKRKPEAGKEAELAPLDDKKNDEVPTKTITEEEYLKFTQGDDFEIIDIDLARSDVEESELETLLSTLALSNNDYLESLKATKEPLPQIDEKPSEKAKGKTNVAAMAIFGVLALVLAAGAYAVGSMGKGSRGSGGPPGAAPAVFENNSERVVQSLERFIGMASERLVWITSQPGDFRVNSAISQARMENPGMEIIMITGLEDGRMAKQYASQNNYSCIQVNHRLEPTNILLLAGSRNEADQPQLSMIVDLTSKVGSWTSQNPGKANELWQWVNTSLAVGARKIHSQK